VEKLRAEPGGEIRMWGSTELIRTLAEHDLVDEYRLLFYPIVLGTGKKLFSDGFPTRSGPLRPRRSWIEAVKLAPNYKPDAGSNPDELPS
jgi:dihydrofolate reductase